MRLEAEKSPLSNVARQLPIGVGSILFGNGIMAVLGVIFNQSVYAYSQGSVPTFSPSGIILIVGGASVALISLFLIRRDAVAFRNFDNYRKAAIVMLPVALAVLDIATTILGIVIYGPKVELNPLVRRLFLSGWIPFTVFVSAYTVSALGLGLFTGGQALLNKTTRLPKLAMFGCFVFVLILGSVPGVSNILFLLKLR